MDPAQLARFGRRSGDQFNVYICDRFVIPRLRLEELRQIGTGELLLDQMTRAYIRDHVGFRYLICPDGARAVALERQVREGALAAGRPYLNPLQGWRGWHFIV